MINRKVLIVEDNKTFRQILKRSLIMKYPDLRIFEAENTSKALKILQTEPLDLVFMDIRLPDGNGFRLTKRIKDRYPQTTIFIITNHDSMEYKEAADQCGADGFLSKRASTLSAIMQAVETILSFKGRRLP
jgi:DNA-binding NarL/FixJ family response regulator